MSDVFLNGPVEMGKGDSGSTSYAESGSDPPPNQMEVAESEMPHVTTEMTTSQIVSVTSLDVPRLDLNAPEFDLSLPAFDWQSLIREQRPVLNMSNCQVHISFGKN